MGLSLIPAAERAYDDIALFPVAERIGLPHSAFALPKPVIVTAHLFGVEISYRLFPNCVGSREQPRPPRCCRSRTSSTARSGPSG